MNFEDTTFLTFEDAALTAALFTSEALKATVSASYSLAPAALSGAPTGRFDLLTPAPFSGAAQIKRASEIYDVQPGAGGSGRSLRADALWQGAVTLRATFPRSEIGVQKFAAPRLTDLDADIVGPAPTDPTALEAARRAVLLARLKANAQNPDAVTDEVIDAWIKQSGQDGLNGLLEGATTVALAQLVLSFDPLPGTATAAPIVFPVAVTAMIRDVTQPDFRLVDFMQAAQEVLLRMDLEGVAPKSAGDTIPQGRAVVALIVVGDWFDDTDWPGGSAGNAAARKADRITRATNWLATQRIVLVPVGG